MYEKDVVKLARENGWYTGKSDKTLTSRRLITPTTQYQSLRSSWSFFRSFDKGMAGTPSSYRVTNEEPMPPLYRP